MSTIADKMNYLNDTKVAIHDAIVAKGVEIPVGTTFRNYASKIAEIASGGSASDTTWTQAWFDAELQKAIDELDPTLVASFQEILPSELEAGKSIMQVQVDDTEYEYVSFVVDGGSGSVTVDWGDGSTTTGDIGQQIFEHKYDYNEPSLVNLTTGSSKIATIVVTVNAGTLHYIDYTFKNENRPSSKFIAINVAGNNLNAFNFRDMPLKYFKSQKNIIINMDNTFSGCMTLTVIPDIDTQNVISMNNMFNYCKSLKAVPLFNTQNVTAMMGMFGFCSSLTTVPLFNTQNVISMPGMFSGCSSLTSVPLFNTQNVTDMNNMFYICKSLTTVPLFNTQNVTNMNGMFSDCSSLTIVPLFNTQHVTDVGGMFNACSSLTTVPLFNTQNVTNMNSMFASCSSLTAVPLFNTSVCTSMSSMFNACFLLKTVPLFNTQHVTDMMFMFYGCKSLKTVPAIDTSSCVGSYNMYYMFGECYALYKNDVIFRSNSSIYMNNYSATELNKIYTNLPIVASASLEVYGNWGTYDDDPSIATAKGWTITG